MRQYFVDRAIVEAKKSEFKQRHGCIIFKGNRIISTGHNEIRHCNKLESRYTRWKNSLHAESRTILFCEVNLLRCSILVVRLNHKGNLVNSKPCQFCLELIQDVGIKNIYYSDYSGNIIKGE